MYGSMGVLVQVVVAQLLLCGWALGAELTFELPDNAKQCFYEDITVGTKCTLEFQVCVCVCVCGCDYCSFVLRRGVVTAVILSVCVCLSVCLALCLCLSVSVSVSLSLSLCFPLRW